jgi:hypothetical protein
MYRMAYALARFSAFWLTYSTHGLLLVMLSAICWTRAFDAVSWFDCAVSSWVECALHGLNAIAWTPPLAFCDCEALTIHQVVIKLPLCGLLGLGPIALAGCFCFGCMEVVGSLVVNLLHWCL